LVGGRESISDHLHRRDTSHLPGRGSVYPTTGTPFRRLDSRHILFVDQDGRRAITPYIRRAFGITPTTGRECVFLPLSLIYCLEEGK